MLDSFVKLKQVELSVRSEWNKFISTSFDFVHFDLDHNVKLQKKKNIHTFRKWGTHDSKKNYIEIENGLICVVNKLFRLTICLIFLCWIYSLNGSYLCFTTNSTNCGRHFYAKQDRTLWKVSCNTQIDWLKLVKFVKRQFFFWQFQYDIFIYLYTIVLSSVPKWLHN